MNYRCHGRKAFLVLLAAPVDLQASAGPISYTCNANIDATNPGTCADLNSVIANIYSSTFSDATASIYIEYSSCSPRRE